VAQHDHVGPHGLEVHRCIRERLAFDDAGRPDGDIQRVGAESLSAISNDVRVRVLGSKNRLTTVLPRRAAPS
jgi:hypothetical protein